MTSKSSQSTGKPSHHSHRTTASEYFGLATLWHTLPISGVREFGVDAVIAWPGIELDRAVKLGTQWWNEGYGKHFLIAGQHMEPVAERLFALPNLQQQYGIHNMIGVESQVVAHHAGIQGAWTAAKIKEHGIKTALFSVPAFHSLRAVLGVLAHLEKLGSSDVLLLPLCPPMSPFEPALLDASNNRRDLSILDTIWGEIDGGPSPRIPAYQANGQNMSTERFINWLAWAYEHPLVKCELLPATQLD